MNRSAYTNGFKKPPLPPLRVGDKVIIPGWEFPKAAEVEFHIESINEDGFTIKRSEWGTFPSTFECDFDVPERASE